MINKLKYIMIVNEAGTLVASFPSKEKYKDQLLSNMLRALQDAFALVMREKVSEVAFERMSAFIFELNNFMIVLVFERKNPIDLNHWLRYQVMRELRELLESKTRVVESGFIEETEGKIGSFFNEYNAFVELLLKVKREFIKYKMKYGFKAVRLMDGFIEREKFLRYIKGIPTLNIEALRELEITIKEINEKLQRLLRSLKKLDEEASIPFKSDKFAQAPL